MVLYGSSDCDSVSNQQQQWTRSRKKQRDNGKAQVDIIVWFIVVASAACLSHFTCGGWSYTIFFQKFIQICWFRFFLLPPSSSFVGFSIHQLYSLVSFLYQFCFFLFHQIPFLESPGISSLSFFFLKVKQKAPLFGAYKNRQGANKGWWIIKTRMT